MDLQSILTSLWSKVNDPLPNILIGLVFMFAAPDGWGWAGWIFFALGFCSGLKVIYPKFLLWKEERRWLKKISKLTEEEYEVLNLLRQENSYSMSEQQAKNGSEQKRYILLQGLVDLKIVKCTTSINMSRYYSFSVEKSVLPALKIIAEKRALKKRRANG